jgi:HSP20 family protein
MTLMRWQPFREMMSLRDAMDRLLEESVVRPARGWITSEVGLRVPLDMYESDGNLVIKADLPGLKAESVDVSIVNDTLTIKGEYQSEEEREEENVHLKERRYGKFQRAIRLPTGVDTEATEATFEDGVLMLTLPKTAEARPKQIPVKTKS